MLDHVTIRVSDRPASERFYRTVLAELGIGLTNADGELLQWDDFSIVAGDGEHPPTRNLHVGFVAPTREAVAAFWRAGLEAGGKDDGEPGERPRYTPSYFGAFLRDPDGNSAEAVIHDDVRRGGHIDHLWMRVRDDELSAGFYSKLAPHLGLREGRRWEHGRQFRGAWATMSVVADGLPLTENLHIAFPAPDRCGVEGFHSAAIAAGYRDSGAPGQRAHYHPGCYSAYVLDPDGTNVGSVFHERAGPPPA